MFGVLRDSRINEEINARVYKTVVRPIIMYGAETGPMKTMQEKELVVAELKMFRRMCGATNMDRIKNEIIRGTTKVTEISRKTGKKTAVVRTFEEKKRGVCGGGVI